MELQNLEIAKCFESPTNPRGAKFEGPEFDELVASVKEKGVLMPILARAVKGKFEIIAGNRRFRAAQKAGLTEIPARVVDMTDTEVREAQIVENLQRADVHPLEEGAAYRGLIENSTPRYEVKDIAAKVGKSESYVRQRLGLTNLCASVAKAFRAGEIKASQAVIIATLAKDKDQEAALYRAKSWSYDGRQLRRWIFDTVYADLKKRPWKDDEELSRIVGDTGGKKTLFKDSDEDADPALYAKQMAAYIEHMVRKEREKGIELVKVSAAYGSASKGVLSRLQYKELETKKERKSKDAKKAIVVEGYDLGKIIWISTAKEKTNDRTNYQQTAEEKAATEKKRAAEKAKEEAVIAKALEKVQWPLSAAHVAILAELCVAQVGYHADEIGERLGVVVSNDLDVEPTVQKAVARLSNREKLQVVFETFIRDSWGDNRPKLIKRL